MLVGEALGIYIIVFRATTRFALWQASMFLRSLLCARHPQLAVELYAPVHGHPIPRMGTDGELDR